jgi:hypothetical protein
MYIYVYVYIGGESGAGDSGGAGAGWGRGAAEDGALYISLLLSLLALLVQKCKY